jgi:hypothetical protein
LVNSTPRWGIYHGDRQGARNKGKQRTTKEGKSRTDATLRTRPHFSLYCQPLNLGAIVPSWAKRPCSRIHSRGKERTLAESTSDGHPATRSRRWLNRTVLGIGLASLFSDWSHEMATTVMPAFLSTMGVAALWVALIDISDATTIFTRLSSRRGDSPV